MSISRKYGRTYHYPFSPGTTSDDRINHEYWDDLCDIDEVIHTEKLDGENNCVSKLGVFARSHAAPTRHPWSNFLKERWNVFKNDLGDLEIFGENMYAIHSIEYRALQSHFYIFGIRDKDMWLSWEEVQFYSEMLDFPVVPEIRRDKDIADNFGKDYEDMIIGFGNRKSALNSWELMYDKHIMPCTMEGVVTRNIDEFPVDKFANNVFKYVRKDHVSTDEHWTRNWKRSVLKWELEARKI